MNDPNDLARLFVTCLPFGLYFTRRGAPLWQRVAGIVSIPLLMYGIVLTNSRGAYVAVMVMVVIMAVRRYGAFKGIVLGAIPMLALIALAPSRMNELNADEESAAGRVEAWYAGILMFRANPIFGIGKGGFLDHHNLTAHNSLVQVFAELGIVGYYFWFALLATAAYALHELLRSSGRPEAPEAGIDDLALSRALLGSYVGLLVTSFFLSRGYELTLFLMLGLVFAHHLNLSSSAPELAAVTVGRFAWRISAWSIGSIAAMHLITKLLI
jgi:O-antigen ligase